MQPKNWIVLLTAATLLGCGRSDTGNPVEPSSSQQTPSTTTNQSVTPTQPNRYLWGLWDVCIDPENLTAQISPQRLAEMHLNTVRLLEVTPCTNCLRIENITLHSPDELSADFVLRHPFPGLIKFTGFDVRGIFISGSDYLFPSTGRTIAWGENLPRLLNADGHTALFNPTEFPEDLPTFPALKYIPGKYGSGGDLTATLNSFIAYCEDKPRRMFAAGSEEARTVLLHWPGWPIEFGYAVDASWQLVEDVIDPLEDFPPDANCLEAYQMSVEVGLDANPAPGSCMEIIVEVFDHQDPYTISSVSFEAPDVCQSVTWLSPSTVTGEDSQLFIGHFDNDLGADPGVYPLLVRAVDTQTDQNLGPVDAWQLCGVQLPEKSPPVALAGADPIPQIVCEPVHFFDNGSFDPDCGWIAKYEWDWDCNGTYEDEGPDAYHSWDAPGIYHVQFRVTDDEGSTDKLDDPLEIVIENALPTAVAEASHVSAYVGETIQFDGSGSHDNDCDGQSIVLWEWDWENDGEFDAGGQSATHSYGEPGMAYIQLRVTDDEGGTDMLDEPLAILIAPAPPKGGWARTWGGGGKDYGRAVAVDGIGSAYVAGSFNSTVDFDPGPGESWHSTGGDSDAFLSKLNTSGEFQWARTWGGEERDVGYGMAVDGSGGVYVAGEFESATLDFDPGPGSDQHTSNGMTDAFLSKFDSNGEFQWARTWGGGELDEALAVTVDGSGNVYVTGAFCGTVDFDPGDGIEQYASNGEHDVFVSRFGSDGEFRWARTWGSIAIGGLGDRGQGVAAHGFGNVWVTGYFEETVDFDPSAGIDEHTSSGRSDVFLSMFDSEGEYQWARTWGGGSDEWGNAVAADGLGGIYTMGFFEATVDFDPGPGTEELISNGGVDVFLSKLDSAGDFLWARTWGGDSKDIGEAVATDSFGNIYVTGAFNHTVDLDPGPGTDEHTDHGEGDVFLSKFDSSGEFLWARSWGGDGGMYVDEDSGEGVAADALGNAYVTGYYYDAVDFDPGPGAEYHFSNGNTDIFVSKFLPDGSW